MNQVGSSRAQGNGMTGALLGVAGGGFAWMVVTGLVIGSPGASALAVLLGLLCFLGGMRLFRARPERRLTVFGLAILWVSAFDLIFVQLYYDEIPDTVGGITTGKEMLSSLVLTIALAILTLLGVALVAWDLRQGKGGTGGGR